LGKFQQTKSTLGIWKYGISIQTLAMWNSFNQFCVTSNSFIQFWVTSNSFIPNLGSIQELH